MNERVSESETLCAVDVESAKLIDSDNEIIAALERLSVNDRVSESATVTVPSTEIVPVNDRVSEIEISAALERLSVNDSVSESEMLDSSV